ncbi:MAG: tetratricopeptide repeat protein [Symploca sp. SIO2B6]|nr:tetratricopeptide repeat protein [Symploca sp. SIO2B6]
MSEVYNRLNEALTACEVALSNPTDWYDVCIKVSNILTSMGRFDDASQWNAMALDTTVDVVLYNVRVAALHTAQGNLDQAIATYHRVLDLDPNYAEAHRSLARLYSRLGKIELELHHWDEFVTLRPDLSNTDNNYRLGQSFQENGYLDRAAICYERIIEQNDQNLNHQQLDQHQLDQQVDDPQADDQPLELDQQQLGAYYNLAEIRTQQQRWDQAIACYEKVLNQDENQALALHKLGKLFLKQKDYEQAIAKFRETTKLAPKFPWAYRGLVETFMEMEQWDEAIATCRAIISLVDDFFWAHKHMGNALMKKGEKMEAIACYQKGLQLQGWDTCVQKDYQFTQDHFSHQLPIWKKHLQHLTNQENINALQIGSDQGLTTCWLLDNILSHSSAQLTCLDQQFSPEFRINIGRSGVADSKILPLEGEVSDLLNTLEEQSYNLVFIEDPLKQAKLMQQAAQLSWLFVQAGGVVIFPSYSWKSPKSSEQLIKQGIDQFLDSVAGQFEILHRGYQLIIRKNIPVLMSEFR